MARAKSPEQSRARSKAASLEELSRGIKQFQEFLDQVEDLGREGFPYLDAARARTELQLRECIRKTFGDKSPEFQTHRHHKLLLGTWEETLQSITLIKSLIAALEDKKLDLQGLKPPAPKPTVQATPKPTMTLVPPSPQTAQVTITPAAPVTPPPMTMSVPLTTNLDMTSATASPAAPAQTPAAPVRPPEPNPPRPQWTGPAVSGKIDSGTGAATPQPSPPSVVPSHSDSQRLRQTGFSTTQEIPAATPQPPRQPVMPPAAAPAPAAPGPIAAPLQSEERSRTNTEQPMATALNEPFQPSPSLPLTPSAQPAPLVPSPIQNTGPDKNPLEFVTRLCHRFHAVAKQLRLRGEYRSTLAVEDDFDAQDLLHALLRLQFDDIGTDEWSPSYAEGSTRTAYLLNHNRLAVVVKKTRPGLSTKDLADHVRTDAERYRAKNGCDTLLCFIYDPEGRIGNPRGLEADLSTAGANFAITVVVSPK